jgi:hypothetical protein
MRWCSALELFQEPRAHSLAACGSEHADHDVSGPPVAAELAASRLGVADQLAPGLGYQDRGVIPAGHLVKVGCDITGAFGAGLPGVSSGARLGVVGADGLAGVCRREGVTAARLNVGTSEVLPCLR